MTYNLPAEFTKFVESAVATGEFASPEEVVAAGLRLLEQRERRQNELRRELQKGIDDLERGDFIAFASPEEIESYFAETIRDCIERADAKQRSA